MAKQIRRWLTPERQLQEWQRGNSMCPSTLSECCPDFSCCEPTLLQPQEVRDGYLRGTSEQKTELLGIFLGGLATLRGLDVFVAGLEGGDDA